MATYYVRADGVVTAANKANATSSAAAATSLNLAQFNDCTGALAFAAGDIVYFSSQGGNYTSTYMVIGSSGSAGNRITYTNVPGETPTIVFPNGSSRGIYISAKSHINVSGFNIRSNSATDFAKGLDFAGACDNVTISDVNIDLSGGTGATRYIIPSAGASTNIVLSNITGTGHTAQGLYFYGAASGPITLENISIVGGTYGYSISKIAGLTINNISISGHSSYSVYSSELSGIVTISGITTTGGTYGYWLQNSTLTAGSKISNSTCTSSTGNSYYLSAVVNLEYNNCNAISGGGGGFVVVGVSSEIDYVDCLAQDCASYGFWASGASANTLTYTDCRSISNNGDGFGVIDDVHDVTYTRCTATGNGTKTSTADGDGFTAHNTNYNIVLVDCLADRNTASGYAMVGTSSGTLTRCKAVNNAGNWSVEGGGALDQVRGGFYFNCTGVNATSGVSWTTRNCVGINNYPNEVSVSAAIKDLIDFDYNQYLSLDITKFASIDGGANDISWETYHVTNGYETNSMYGIGGGLSPGLVLSGGNRPPWWNRRRR